MHKHKPTALAVRTTSLRTSTGVYIVHFETFKIYYALGCMQFSPFSRTPVSSFSLHLYFFFFQEQPFAFIPHDHSILHYTIYIFPWISIQTLCVSEMYYIYLKQDNEKIITYSPSTQESRYIYYEKYYGQEGRGGVLVAGGKIKKIWFREKMNKGKEIGGKLHKKTGEKALIFYLFGL